MRLIFGVASERQPEAGHAFAERGRAEQAINQAFVGIGAFIGGWLWGQLHLPMIGNFWINAIVTATVGAVILLFILRLIRR